MTILSDLELPSCPPLEQEEQAEATSRVVTEESATGETIEGKQVPMTLSVVSDMTDSNPPSPVTEAPGIPIGGASEKSSVASGKGRITDTFIEHLKAFV